MPDTSLPAQRTTVLIVGGGLAGMTMAAILGRAGVDVTIIDRAPRTNRSDAAFDGRTTAIAAGPQATLERAGIWPLVADEGSPILDIRIADGKAPVFLHFDHREVGDRPFGHIIDNRLLRLAQFEVIDGLETVTHQAPATLIDLNVDKTGCTAMLAEGGSITANLVIGADGRGSLVREFAGIDTVSWPYDQKALVFSVFHELDHQGLALEHFKPGGPFAVLPLLDDEEGRHRSSVVWSERSSVADRLARLDDDRFNSALAEAMGDYLGTPTLAGRRFVYPLNVVHANAYVSERVALINESAHGIHPIAGQGLNVGLRDVELLADIVIEACGLGLDPGTYRLAEYGRRRRADVLSMLAATDGLNRLFSTDFPPVQVARDVGLAIVGRVPPLKKFFMRRAMGVGPIG